LAANQTVQNKAASWAVSRVVSGAVDSIAGSATPSEVETGA
jgi:hypothetical protein